MANRNPRAPKDLPTESVVEAVTENTTDEPRVREAYQKLGHLGGQAVKKKYGPEFYSQIGKKGGDTVKAKYGKGFYHNIGEKGGEARKEQLGHVGYQELGHIGGEIVKGKYGAGFYSQIGKKGGEKGGEARKAQMARGEIVTRSARFANEPNLTHQELQDMPLSEAEADVSDNGASTR